jgi:hypothetical protein
VPRPGLPLAVLACMLLLGCSREDEQPLPAACRQGEDAVLAALRDAPARAAIDGVSLSECLTHDSDAGDVQEVGGAFLGAAAELAPKAASRPKGREAVQLGYLIGAARRGARNSQGLHSEMLRRLEGELVSVDTRSPAFRRGETAGRRTG